MIKKVFMVAILILLIIGMGGCMERKYTNAEKKELVLEYLKNKYGQEFEGKSYSTADLMRSYDEYWVYPKNGTQEDIFEVWGTYTKDGKYEITDGYFGIIIHDEYEKVMRSFIDEKLNKYKLYLVTSTNGNLPERLNKETKINEIYLKGDLPWFTADTFVYLKESLAKNVNLKDAAYHIANKMIENKLVGRISINVIRDERYDLINKGNWTSASDRENYIDNYDLTVTHKLIILDYKGGSKKWQS